MKNKLLSALVLAATPLLTHAVMAETIGVIGENGTFLEVSSMYTTIYISRCQDLYDPDEKDAECKSNSDIRLSIDEEDFVKSAKDLAVQKRILPGVAAAEYDSAAKLLNDDQKKKLAKLEKELAWYTEYVPSNTVAIERIKKEKATLDTLKLVQREAIEAAEKIEAAATAYSTDLLKLIASDQLHVRVPKKTTNYVSRSHEVLTDIYLLGRRKSALRTDYYSGPSRGETDSVMACEISHSDDGQIFKISNPTNDLANREFSLREQFKGAIPEDAVVKFEESMQTKLASLVNGLIEAGQCDDLKLPYTREE